MTDAAESFRDFTFNANVTWRIGGGWQLHALSGRGFRAPNLNDLGALGLNDLGYEVPASEARTANALKGTSDGENALPTGEPVAALRAESLYNYELGVSYQAPTGLRARTASLTLSCTIRSSEGLCFLTQISRRLRSQGFR